MTPLEVLRRYPPHDYTLYGALASRAQSVPGHVFIEFRDARLSYVEARAYIHDTIALLASYGVKPGDRIAVMSQNHPASVAVLIALSSLGAIMVGVNPDFGEKEARYVLEHSGSSGIICSPSALPTVQAVADTLATRPWIMTNDAPLENIAGSAPAAASRADDVCLIIYTSGTTGFPKGVMHSQRSIVLAGEGFVRRMHLQPDERVLCILPMFHVNAIFYSLMGTIAAGATLLLEEKFSASSFWKTVAARRATQVNTIAAVMNILMRRPREEFVPHTLTKIYGAPFSPEIYRVFEEEFGVPDLIEGYGMSEIPGALSNPFDGERRKGAMGKPSLHPDPAVNLAQVKIVDDDFNEVPAGTTGEILVRTPTIMKGYYRDPEATAAAFRDGYFLTGDLARMDAGGYMWFVARKKDIIRRRGENISGAEIDLVAGDHPEVVEAAAIGVAAELGEDEVLLAVVRKPGSSLTEHDLGEWCRARLAAFKVPRFVLFVDKLPRTPTHRIAKFELRKDPTLKQRAVDLSRKGTDVARTPKPLHSELGWSTPDRITVRGLDLPSEIMGHFNLGDMAFFELTGRKPTPQESKLFNAIAVTLVEHGMTPSAIAARMTIAGAPEAMQAAVAAGLCGLGSVFVGSMEHVAVLLEQALPYGKDHGKVDLDRLASDIVERHRSEKKIVPGIGHPIHKPVDPRVTRLFEIAKETGFHGRYVELMQRIQQRAESASGRVLPMNATGAIGALSCELGFPPRIVRGFGVLARAIGLVGHILEEWKHPMALEIWQRVDEEASEEARSTARK